MRYVRLYFAHKMVFRDSAITKQTETAAQQIIAKRSHCDHLTDAIEIAQFVAHIS